MAIDARRKRHKINKENARNKAREFIAAYFATHPCADCGESDRIVLTFDHVCGDKRDNVADMVMDGLGIETIKTEVEKCDVVCFNCHSLRTQERTRAYRWQRRNKGG